MKFPRAFDQGNTLLGIPTRKRRRGARNSFYQVPCTCFLIKIPPIFGVVLSFSVREKGRRRVSPKKKTTFRSFLLRRRPGATSGERRLLKKRGVNFSRNYFRPLPFTPLPPIFFFLKKFSAFIPYIFGGKRREGEGGPSKEKLPLFRNKNMLCSSGLRRG